MKQETLQLTGGNFRGDRRELDFYPTPRAVTEAIMIELDERGILPKTRIVWEPCCGDYAMSSVIESYGYKVISTDIKYGDDYLQTTVKADALITNPPFYLAEQMIRKASTEVKLLALLLKSQFWHAKGRLDLFNDVQPSYIFPLTWRPDFYEHQIREGKKNAPTMEVCWNVWHFNGTKSPTQYKPLIKPLFTNP